MTAKDELQQLELIVGLGNPGSKYSETRHNAGFWFLDELAQRYHSSFKSESRFSGELCKLRIQSRDILLLKPSTFMNASGRSVSAVAKYFKVDTPQILVIHDEIDLPPGSIRLKSGGGHGGHNGLRDISASSGKEFWRLRLGVGHPGHKDAVVGYVLKRASQIDQRQIDDAISDGLMEFESIIDGQMNKAMQTLHSR